MSRSNGILSRFVRNDHQRQKWSAEARTRRPGAAPRTDVTDGLVASPRMRFSVDSSRQLPSSLKSLWTPATEVGPGRHDRAKPARYRIESVSVAGPQRPLTRCRTERANLSNTCRGRNRRRNPCSCTTDSPWLEAGDLSNRGWHRLVEPCIRGSHPGSDAYNSVSVRIILCGGTKITYS